MQKIFSNFKFSFEINLIFLSAFLFAVAMGINFVTFPTLLNNQQVLPSYIGFSYSLECFGGILMSFILGKIVARLGIIVTLKIAAFSYAAIILGIYFYQNFYLWAILSFLMGILWISYVITRQSWLNMLLPEGKRAIASGIFSMVMASGIAVGPIITKFSGAESYFSFIISANITILSLFCLFPLKKLPKLPVDAKIISLKEFFRDNPRVFLARFLLDFKTYILLTLTVIFGSKIGLSYEASGLLITAFMLSGFSDVIVGIILQKTCPYKLIKLGFRGAFCCFLSLIFIRNYILLLSAYFIFGVFVACIFVPLLKIVNDDYSKEKLVAANATFQLIGSIGSIFGSLIGGFLFTIFGNIGFPMAIILSSIIYLIFLFFYDKKHY